MEILKSRQAHKKLRDIFIRGAEEHLGEELVTSLLDSQVLPIDDPELAAENNGIGPARSISEIENQMLPFPSCCLQVRDLPNLPNDRKATIQTLRSIELQLRIGHAEDCLEAVRGALIQVSWVFKNKVRGAEGADRTRSYDRVHALNKIWQLKRLVYNGNRHIIFSLNPASDFPMKYPALLATECNATTVIEAPNAQGQSSKRLPWFWSSTRGSGDIANTNSEHYNECKLFLKFPQYITSITSVFRVHWLRARAQRGRWAEELVLVKNEMKWTVNFYMYMAQTWQQRRDSFGAAPSTDRITRGCRAFAERQLSIWNNLGEVSERAFRNVDADFESDRVAIM